MTKKDITRQVEFEYPRGDLLPITVCACRNCFWPGDFLINIHSATPTACTKCGRRLYWGGNVRVFEVTA